MKSKNSHPCHTRSGRDRDAVSSKGGVLSPSPLSQGDWGYWLASVPAWPVGPTVASLGNVQRGQVLHEAAFHKYPQV